jgi:hypothetical protein
LGEEKREEGCSERSLGRGESTAPLLASSETRFRRVVDLRSKFVRFSSSREEEAERKTHPFAPTSPPQTTLVPLGVRRRFSAPRNRLVEVHWADRRDEEGSDDGEEGATAWLEGKEACRPSLTVCWRAVEEEQHHGTRREKLERRAREGASHFFCPIRFAPQIP